MRERRMNKADKGEKEPPDDRVRFSIVKEQS